MKIASLTVATLFSLFFGAVSLAENPTDTRPPTKQEVAKQPAADISEPDEGEIDEEAAEDTNASEDSANDSDDQNFEPPKEEE